MTMHASFNAKTNLIINKTQGYTTVFFNNKIQYMENNSLAD